MIHDLNTWKAFFQSSETVVNFFISGLFNIIIMCILSISLLAVLGTVSASELYKLKININVECFEK